MRILITGAGGYVGSVLCRHLLARGYWVRAMDNFHRGQCDALIPLCSYHDFEFVHGDVTKKEEVEKAVDGVDAVVHLAAIVGFPACDAQPALAEFVNFNGTKILAESTDVPIVFASTGSVYGKVEETCTETTSLNTLTLYGKTKLWAEQELLERGNVVSLRFATGYGISPNMRVNLLVNDLTYQCYHNKCAVIFQADARRTFVHVEDMASAFEYSLRNFGAMEKDPVYNAGSDDGNWTKRELAEYISEKTGAHISYVEFKKDADQRDYEVSYAKINDCGWRGIKDLKTGIDELVDVAKLIRINHQYK